MSVIFLQALWHEKLKKAAKRGNSKLEMGCLISLSADYRLGACPRVGTPKALSECHCGVREAEAESKIEGAQGESM